MKIQIVSIKDSFFKLCFSDKELLHNHGEKRPHLIVVKLKYKGQKYEFALPLRTNISGSTPTNHFFPLPSHAKTKQGNHHGIHFEKMFPIDKKYKEKLNNSGNIFFVGIVEAHIKSNFKAILQAAQDYLSEYEKGNRSKYSVDIDYIIKTQNL